jgi:hypothetical protein
MKRYNARHSDENQELRLGPVTNNDGNSIR